MSNTLATRIANTFNGAVEIDDALQGIRIVSEDVGNGYGFSVVRNAMSYGGASGLFELAVLHNGSICYQTPVTGDVLGWLKPEDVLDAIRQIASLPLDDDCTHEMPSWED